MPLGSVTRTAWVTASTVGLSSLRSARGATKKPSSSAAVARSRPEMNSAELKILAYPAAECSRGSPGGICHWVGSSLAPAGCVSKAATNQTRAVAKAGRMRISQMLAQCALGPASSEQAATITRSAAKISWHGRNAGGWHNGVWRRACRAPTAGGLTGAPNRQKCLWGVAARMAMRARAVVSLLAAAGLCLAQAGSGNAGDAMTLAPGLYEVRVRLDLPNLEGAAAARLATLCVPADDRAGNHGLVVLSENNPLAHCPVANVRQQGSALTFDIVCPGGNAAIASASYLLAGETFEGRIAIKLGGKNMTMTETQTGRRTGQCRP